MDREELKKELLEELKKEYQLVPIKEAKFTIKDVLEVYRNDIAKHCGLLGWDYSTKTETMLGAIRTVLCMHYGVSRIVDIPKNQRSECREEAERFIKEYILGGK